MRDKLFLYDAVIGISSIRCMTINGGRSDEKVVIAVGSEFLAAVLMKIKYSGMLHSVDW